MTMRTVTMLVIHCSATSQGVALGFESCRLDHNRHSIGICYEGGLDAQHRPADTRTPEQKASLLALLKELKARFPKALVVGHHDLNPMKECPCFEAAKEYKSVING